MIIPKRIRPATKNAVLKKTTSKPIIPIFFATDDNFVPFLHVAIQSMLANASKKYSYNIHILHTSMSEGYKKSFDVFKSQNVKIFVDDISDIAENCSHLMTGKFYGGGATYYRVFIPRLYPQYKKILYLDGDIAVNGDISELYNTNLGSNLIAAIVESIINAVPEFKSCMENFVGIPGDEYINAGIYVMNADMARKINYEEIFFEILRTVDDLDVCPDQDCLNLIARGKIVFLHDTWNITPSVSPNYKPEEVKIAHYKVADKPWKVDGVPYSELFWKHAKNTVFYNKLLEIKKSADEDAKKKAANEMSMGGKARMNAIQELAGKLGNSGKRIDYNAILKTIESKKAKK